jgi:hypothetical protein
MLRQFTTVHETTVVAVVLPSDTKEYVRACAAAFPHAFGAGALDIIGTASDDAISSRIHHLHNGGFVLVETSRVWTILPTGDAYCLRAVDGGRQACTHLHVPCYPEVRGLLWFDATLREPLRVMAGMTKDLLPMVDHVMVE